MPHARLQPSSAGRWSTCPGSVAFAEAFPDRPTRPAAEGTACHSLLHDALTRDADPYERVGAEVEVEGFRIEITEDMADWVTEIADWVRAYVAGYPGAQLLSEERVCPGLVFGCPDDLWGTSDVLVSAPARLLVLDAKFGYRKVPVERNPQLLSYALGAMAEFGWVHPAATLAIYQPRAGGYKSWDLTAAELEDEARKLAPRVAAALLPGGALVPSEEACEFCPAAGACPAAQEQTLAMARREFGPETISRADLLTILDSADRVRDALSAAEQYAETLLATGQDLPGWIRVYGNKRRAWVDPAKAEKTLRDLGYDPMRPKIVTPAQAEKLVGKATARLLAPLIERPRGEPVLAREGDPRDPVAPEFPAVLGSD